QHLPIYVIATTDKETERALGEARRLSQGLLAHITVLIPHQVSYVTSLNEPFESPGVITAWHRRLAASAGVDASIELCLCRRKDDVFRSVLPKHSLVVIGARCWQWSSTETQRLTRRLRKLGHTVIVASADARHAERRIGSHLKSWLNGLLGHF